MTWLGYFRPILTCSGIIPLIFALTWSGQTRIAAISSPILGFVTGLTIWLCTAKSMYGKVNLTTTGSNLPALYGAIGSMFSPAIYSVLISQYKPYKFDWREFLRIELLEDVNVVETPTSGSSTFDISEKEEKISDTAITPIPANSSSETSSSHDQDPENINPTNEKSTVLTASAALKSSSRQISLDDITHPFSEETLRELHHWYKIAWVFWVVIVLITFVLWPLPLYRNYVFTKSFFAGWTTVAIIWQFFAFFAVVVFPLYDGRHAITKGTRGVWGAVQKVGGAGGK